MLQKTLVPAACALFFAATALASTDYAPAVYKPMSGCSKWYTSGNGHYFAVIHDMEGYYATSISYLNRCDLKADGTYAVGSSIHYLVNGKQDATSDYAAGEITQSVREAYYAWHARCFNTYSWGTEHEGFASNPAWYTEAMYVASAGLQRHLLDKTAQPIDRNHLIGHDQKRISAWVTWANANFAFDPTCNTHTDPGLNWDWTHFMQLVAGGPVAPSALVLTPVSTTAIKLSWTDNSTNELGFKIERATSSAGPWTSIRTNAANVTIYTNSSLVASTVYYYQVRAYNTNGNSGYTPIKSATTGNSAPTLNAIGTKSVMESLPLTFTAKAIDTGVGAVTSITDFETFSNGSADIMFRKPFFSSSTTNFLSLAYPDSTVIVTGAQAGHSGTAVLQANWAFKAGSNNAWLRLTTASGVSKPNPVIDLRQIVKFDVFCNQPIKVALGLRETTTAAGTAIGSDGGGTGTIEWAGATNSASSPPVPTRTVAANTWTTLQFNLPFESVRSFTGNGTLSTASGLAVLEHLAIVPTATTTTNPYTLLLDNFSVVYSNTLTYTLDAGAPAGASINPYTGLFTWTPTEAQGPNEYDVTVRVTDMGTPPLDDFETILIRVNETNNAGPTLATITDKTVMAGDTLTFTNSAGDIDIPADLEYSLDAGAPADAEVNVVGVFSWTPPVDAADSTNVITLRVSDAGPNVLTAARTFSVRVVSKTARIGAVDGNGEIPISWSTLAGKKYRVQYKVDLGDPVWTDETGDLNGTGTPISQSLTATNGAQRFYRIIEVP
jgi:N-acetyl-anhydromuramyl-L-alanine amidase AmpD